MNAVNQEQIFRAAVPYLRPATQYEFWVTGFTQKREGVSSPVLRTRTDTAKPGPPVITNTNCTGALIHALFFASTFPNILSDSILGSCAKNEWQFLGISVFQLSSLELAQLSILEKIDSTGDGDILLEWRRPATTHGRVNFYVIYYKSDQVPIFATHCNALVVNF